MRSGRCSAAPGRTRCGACARPLEAYFEELANVSRTARRLGVHENTVQYRLHGAAELLGRSVQERPLEPALALAIARLLPPEPGDGDSPEDEPGSVV